MKKILSSLALLFSVFLVGCATDKVMMTNVTASHTMSTPTGMKYTMVPHKEQEEDIEYKDYARAVSAELQKIGMVEVDPSEASIAVFIRYGTDNGREVATSHPIIRQTGTTSNTYGTVNMFDNTAILNSTTYNRPTYGVVGYEPRLQNLYRRFFDLEIVEMSSLMSGAKINKLYEGKALSEGVLRHPSIIIPPMIQSIFKEFPGENGKTRVVSIYMPSCMEEHFYC